MACSECNTTECIKLYVNPCDSGIDTGIILDTTGEYRILTGFNGSFQESVIEVTEGESIVLPNSLNAPYTHTMMIYDSDGVLVNDTCYSLKLELSVGISNSLVPNVICDGRKIITVDEDGQDFTNSFFGMYTILSISTNNQTYIAGTDFTQSGSTITAISFGFYVGQTILAEA